MFLQDGATRFVFEGKECGGHVGPRTSFVLWEQMSEEIIRFLASKSRAEATAYHVLFAGVSTMRSQPPWSRSLLRLWQSSGYALGSPWAPAISSPQRRCRQGHCPGLLQEEALKSQATVLFETGPGHAIRCADTPYRELFNQEKRRSYAEGKPLKRSGSHWSS